MYVFPGQCSRPVRATGARLVAAIAAEKLDEFGNPTRSSRRHHAKPLKPRASNKRKQTAMDNVDTDVEDETFAVSVTDSDTDDSDDDSDSDGTGISNGEVPPHFILISLQFMNNIPR